MPQPPPSASARLALVVEDEPHIRDLVTLHLELDGWRVVSAGDGEAGLQQARAAAFDLIVLDVMLPRLDGLTVLGAIRRDSPNIETPILLLTARREEADKVLGLETGADDYLTKPFGVRELVARARALTRRPRTRPQDDAASLTAPTVPKPVRLQGVIVDPARRQVTVRERPIDLTAREFDLLYLLVSHPGIVFTREALLARVWKGDTFVTERNVDTLIKRLRRKIEADPADPALLLTVWGSGYKAADV